MKNFNKENFFNYQMEKRPDVANHFCEWIDKYKEKVGWDNLFLPEVKFHHLPIEMQRGIMELYLDQFEGDNGAVSLGLKANQVDEAELTQFDEIFEELDFYHFNPKKYKTSLENEWRIIPNL